ncbi:unnamed protein product [Didymodactylos carnosus]|uniref:Uncharacterized protein n=1 Tax=Didymodactylos carnosus TaxID=1234261 RepID=A0A8S2DVX5_9BILA|nr:unnamed protein product [Didymodactylos carnosus]CAF3831539.1 unnamed protein product [Didymodactylos carnosus]CAF4300858.1 unnamed protein product [Didymodactylos carnosus]
MVTANEPPALSRTLAFIYDVVIVGDGQSGMHDTAAIARFPEERPDTFNQIIRLGGKYDVNTLTIGRGPKVASSHGNAWGNDQGLGMANSKPEKLLDNAQRILNYVAENKELLREKFKSNVPLHASFEAVEKRLDQGITPDEPFLARSVLGEIDRLYISETIASAANNIPFLKQYFLYNTEVTSIDAKTPLRPEVKFTDKTKGEQGSAIGRHVLVNTGTELKNPLPPELHHISYVGPMNTEALIDHFRKMKLIDGDPVNEHLKADTKILIFGANLSSLDALQAVAPLMRLYERVNFRHSASGIKVTDFAKSNYRNCIKVVSRSTSTIPPRCSQHSVYSRPLPSDRKPVSDWRMYHAGMLHFDSAIGFDACSILTDAEVAEALNITPKQTREDNMTFKEKVNLYHEDSQNMMELEHKADNAAAMGNIELAHHLRSQIEQLPTSVKRQLTTSGMIGMHMTQNSAATLNDIKKYAPHTLHGQIPFAHVNAVYNGLTLEGCRLAETGNGEMVEKFEKDMLKLTAAPVRSAEQFFILSEAGILSHQRRDIADLKLNPINNTIQLEDDDGNVEEYSTIIANKVFSQDTPLRHEMSNRFRTVGKIPTLALHLGTDRVLTNNEGKVTTVHYMGLGQAERTTLKQDGTPIPNGKSSLVGGTNYDVNNAQGIWVRTINTAYRFWGKVHLKTSGSPNPEEEQRKIYKSLESSKEEFDNEVRTFAHDFGRLMTSRDYIQQAEKLAGSNGKIFGLMKRELTNYLSSSEGIATIKHYANLFRPITYTEHRRLYPRYTVEHHQAVYEQAVRQAVDDMLNPEMRRERLHGRDAQYPSAIPPELIQKTQLLTRTLKAFAGTTAF